MLKDIHDIVHGKPKDFNSKSRFKELVERRSGTQKRLLDMSRKLDLEATEKAAAKKAAAETARAKAQLKPIDVHSAGGAGRSAGVEPAAACAHLPAPAGGAQATGGAAAVLRPARDLGQHGGLPRIGGAGEAPDSRQPGSRGGAEESPGGMGAPERLPDMRRKLDREAAEKAAAEADRAKAQLKPIEVPPTERAEGKIHRVDPKFAS